MQFWMFGIDGKEKHESFRILEKTDFHSLVTGYDEETIGLAAQFHMDLYLCSGTYGASGQFSDSKYLSEDINGNKHIWFGSTCPNKEEVRKHNIDILKKWASKKEVKGIFLDGARFASPCSNPVFDSFFTCFCKDCENKAVSLGFNFSQMRKDVKRLYDSFHDKREDTGSLNFYRGGFDLIALLQEYQGVYDWLNFRKACTTEHIINVAKAVKETNNISMGIFIFTPGLAVLVGQSYIDLKNHIDIFSPMIYRAYKAVKGPACLNHELARLIREIKLPLGQNELNAVSLVSALTGIDLSGYNTEEAVLSGLPVSCIQEETRKARALLGNDKILIPIILLNDDCLKKSIEAVEKGGANGVNFFLYDKAVISSMNGL